MKNRCVCGHHRLSHTYTREANIGPCEAGPADHRCACAKYEEQS